MWSYWVQTKVVINYCYKNSQVKEYENSENL